MANPEQEEIEFEIPNLFRIYKTGEFLRLTGTDKLPASIDPSTSVHSKDITIDPTAGITARLYLPPIPAARKLPLLVYFHGGAFCLESAFSPLYHQHLNKLSSLAPLIAVSVNYRLAPEHPLPAGYDDCWAALRWVFSSSPDPWISSHADFDRVFIAGDSAGANISHHMALRSKEESGIKIKGVALIHPYFWGSKPIDSESTDPALRAAVEKIWEFACPNSTGPDDPRINPNAENAPSLANLGCKKMLVAVAENDSVKYRGKAYYEKIKGDGWDGELEFFETPDSGHVFHLFYPDSDKAKEFIHILVDFFNKE